MISINLFVMLAMGPESPPQPVLEDYMGDAIHMVLCMGTCDGPGDYRSERRRQRRRRRREKKRRGRERC